MFQNLCVWPRALVYTIALLTSTLQGSQAAPEPLPSWVEPIEFSLETPEGNTEADYTPLLYDTQVNLQKETTFYHKVYKVISQEGIKPVSQLRIAYNPSYQKVAMHNIQVFRAETWQDRLTDPRTKATTHQGGSNSSYYSEHNTLVYVLSDIREGDIIDYSYSLIGDIPLKKANFSDWVRLQYHFSAGKRSYRLVANSDFSLNIKQFNTTVQPTITDLSKTTREWKWEVINPTPHKAESPCPRWHTPLATVQLSQNHSWQEVVQSVIPYYQLPDEATLLTSNEVCSFIEQWMMAADTPEGRALLALRFVQDEIRYLSLDENPTDGHKPADPLFTLKNRYGDCKAKSYLLEALLKLMDIPSHIALVHTNKGKNLDELLPTPFGFNHVVLQIQIDDKTFWVDPTASLQGGNLSTNPFPNFHYGLIIGEETTDLIPLPKTTDALAEINTHFTIETKERARLKTTTTYHGSEADYFRYSINKRGARPHSDMYLARTQKLYGDATLDQEIQIKDDREKNIFSIINSCIIPIEEKNIDIPTQTLDQHLLTDINPRMQAPRAIPYPYHIKERIQIDNRFGNYEPEETHFENTHPAITYKHIMKTSSNTIEWEAELQHHDDHIPQKMLRKYWLDKKAIWRNTTITFDLTDPTNSQ